MRITLCAAVSCLRRTLLSASARRGSLSQTSLPGKGRNGIETAITVNWVTGGVDCCHVGFLPRAYALEGAIYEGVLCRVTKVFLKSDPSCAIHEKWHLNKGFARATVISALNERVLPIGSVETLAVAGMKGDYLP